MIPESDLKIICHYAKEYGANAIFLFGSSLCDSSSAHDIDLGVIGIEPAKFFSFYGELLMKLNQPVDLIDLSRPSKFSALVMKRGKKIYG